MNVDQFIVYCVNFKNLGLFEEIFPCSLLFYLKKKELIELSDHWQYRKLQVSSYFHSNLGMVRLDKGQRETHRVKKFGSAGLQPPAMVRNRRKATMKIRKNLRILTMIRIICIQKQNTYYTAPQTKSLKYIDVFTPWLVSTTPSRIEVYIYIPLKY